MYLYMMQLATFQSLNGMIHAPVRRFFLKYHLRRKHPKRELSRRQTDREHIKECSKDDKWCGYKGPGVEYEHEPHTTFQKRCRSRPTQDIQQYTRTYGPEKVERRVC